MKTYFFFLFALIIAYSCNYPDLNEETYNKNNISYINNSNDNNKNDTYSYEFMEGYIKTNDNIDLYYRFFYNENNKNLIILTHKEDSSLEEWEILLDIFKNLNYNIILYDMRGYGKSKAEKEFDKDISIKDLSLIVNFAASNMDEINQKVFLGNGTGANVILYSSQNYCSPDTSFIMLSPNLQNEEISIKNFHKYCNTSKYLFIYSDYDLKDTDRNEYIYNYENKETYLDEIENFSGINLLLNNPTALNKIVKILKSE